MPFPFGAALIGGAALVGGILGNRQSAANTAAANAAGMENSERQRQWQQAMSETEYQRAMNDMRSAGLNPMLAFSQGGASTPPGAMYSPQVAEYNDPIGPAMSSAVQAKQVNAQIENLEAETQKKKSDISVNESIKDLQFKQGQQALSSARSQDTQALLNAQLGHKVSIESRMADAQDRMIRAGLPRAEARAKVEAEYGDKLGKIDAILDRLGGALSGAKSAKDIATPKNSVPRDYFKRRAP